MRDIRFLTKTLGSRSVLLAGILAPLVLTVAVVLAGFLESEYSHVSQFVSELGASQASHQWILNYGGLFPSGLLTAVFSVGMYFRLRPGRLFGASSALVGLVGLGRLVAGIFPCDPGCSLEGMSTSAKIHALAGFVAFVSGALAPMVLAFGLRRRGQNLLLTTSAGLSLASIVLVVLLFGLGPGTPYIGIVQRLALAAFYGWVVFVALEMGALRRHGREGEEAA